MPFANTNQAGRIHAAFRVDWRGQSLFGLLLTLAEAIVAAQRLSRERQQLAEMDARQLNDIGLTEADRAAELRKPVWRR